MTTSQSSVDWYTSIEPDRAEEVKLDFAVSLERTARELGITKADIARKTGVSPARITKALRGDSNLTINTMEKLAEAVHKTIRIYLATPNTEVFHFEAIHSTDQQIEMEIEPLQPSLPYHHFPVIFDQTFDKEIMTVLE